jgi:hypothetical protein
VPAQDTTSSSAWVLSAIKLPLKSSDAVASATYLTRAGHLWHASGISTRSDPLPVDPVPVDPVPLHESVDQELQVDRFFFIGQAFFICFSVLLGLIMITHLGPSLESNYTKTTKFHHLQWHSSQYLPARSLCNGS